MRDGILAERHHVGCPYKGVASYEHVSVGGRRYEDAAWCYREPLLEALPAAGHRSFDVEVQVSACGHASWPARSVRPVARSDGGVKQPG